MIISREELISKIKRLIESRFDDVVVIHTGIALSDDEFDISEEFEVLGLKKEDYRNFRALKWEIREKYENAYGYSLIFHALSPEATEKHRWVIYQRELAKKHNNRYLATTIRPSKSQSVGYKINLVPQNSKKPNPWNKSVDQDSSDINKKYAHAA